MPNAPEKPKLRKVTRVVRSPDRTIPGLPDDCLTDYSLTPLQLLGVILKVVLKDRITDEEVDRISAVYYDTISKWWSLIPTGFWSCPISRVAGATPSAGSP
ncbi:MAG TPA: hypothetical protein VEZ90_03265 [Blastocatellia bacterium]|nr:hypothetical protein [Blastocatellia bacterium]